MAPKDTNNTPPSTPRQRPPQKMANDKQITVRRQILANQGVPMPEWRQWLESIVVHLCKDGGSPETAPRMPDKANPSKKVPQLLAGLMAGQFDADGRYFVTEARFRTADTGMRWRDFKRNCGAHSFNVLATTRSWCMEKARGLILLPLRDHGGKTLVFPWHPKAEFLSNQSLTPPPSSASTPPPPPPLVSPLPNPISPISPMRPAPWYGHESGCPPWVTTAVQEAYMDAMTLVVADIPGGGGSLFPTNLLDVAVDARATDTTKDLAQFCTDLSTTLSQSAPTQEVASFLHNMAGAISSPVALPTHILQYLSDPIAQPSTTRHIAEGDNLFDLFSNLDVLRQ